MVASIKKENWADQVVQEEFSRLKEAVAADIRDGNKTHAQQRIRDYEARQSAIIRWWARKRWPRIWKPTSTR